MSDPILAADHWATNADLIADVHRLGHLNDNWLTLDPTYGRGLWWTKWRPARLVAHDLDPARAPDGPADFTRLPYRGGCFGAVAFDPPYVSVGGRRTTGMSDLHNRYGLSDAPKSPAGLQELINAGLDECNRVLRPGGVLLVKCQDYISSGKLWTGTHHTLSHALSLGMGLVDRLEHLGGVRPQPPGRRQVHARRNLSTLFVLRTPRRGDR